ncbi:hypothetical protein NKT34_13845 [Paenibacillus polysaccharolyticus]|uniref:hypothetical protein n=1 Tax=Paenibacillus polysaccharolyticus TaxID=582692 RepID=UPI00209FC985|nr:hypothetical protein [Paenibacillus polysaccharolyticus]MCP1134383.1 hypothetical protein [Paenibacillus polysaccharolyticus]
MKKYIIYLVIPLSILLFGLFVYPTLYKYDKLDQKKPVMINRITGEAKILTSEGWVESGQYESAAKEMRTYRDEINARIDSLSDEVRDKVLSSISDDIQALKEEATQAAVAQIEQEEISKAEIKKFKKGSTMSEVEESMGTADQVSSVIPGEETWFYGGSIIYFKDGSVTGWRNLAGNLNLE